MCVKTETRVGLFIFVAIGIFLYLSINIKALRFDKHQFYTYRAYFDDTGGLVVRSPVKIAGVEVGWVDAIELLDNGKAEVIMHVNKNNRLSKNAYAMIHQDNLIGTKTLEIDPGTPDTGILLPGSTLSMPGRTPASIGELLDQFRDIATTIQDITSAFKNVFATHRGEENMRMALHSVAKATDKLVDFSELLQKTMQRNEKNINDMISDFRETALSLKRGVPAVTDDVHSVSQTLNTGVNKITEDFSGTAQKVGSAFEHLEDAAIQTKDTLREAGQVMEKVNTGKGVIGKLINEDETYGDLKKTVKGLRDYVGRTQALMLNLDMHSETMLRQKNSKGVFEMRLRPNSDCFYLLQLTSAEKGGISRDTTYTTRRDDKGDIIDPSTAKDNTQYTQMALAYQVDSVKQKKNDLLFGLQFGKRFDRLALRLGLMENTVGFGVDYYIPLETDYFHWITTFEAYDFNGVNRLNDDRPHVKWLNKIFFLKNLYTTFGVDDVCSKNSANPFIGGGLRFGDDDIKYFIGSLPIKMNKN
jgi:phospholipid/cholesterol/gamma-HCH transport system substrate-binding protein